MIREVLIENYKSIERLSLSLGRLTVLIGANGCGKSTVLEALALISAAANDKLDNEFLSSRGVRVTDDPRFMRSAFEQRNVTQEIGIIVRGEDNISFECSLQNTNEPYSPWIDGGEKYLGTAKEINKLLDEYIKEHNLNDNEEVPRSFFRLLIEKNIEPLHLSGFLIYSPENSSLRIFEQEGQIQPLGIKGEGLFKLLKVLSLKKNKDRLDEIKTRLKLLDWFNDFKIPQALSTDEKTIRIKDKYLDDRLSYFDQMSANEGFLFLLFYFTLFVSKETPKFFAIDNIDASLNPKLCSQLVIELNQLANEYDKQAIFTTHNPAILDGLNLDDDEQRLFVIYRNKLGHTKAERIFKPKPIHGQEPVRLSEAFLRGYLGGLPKNF
ncbi:MAG: AAA family ATPase [Blastocatellia bacterium]|nr:AAA family ATPase [Blastocatellia bacterium]